MSNMANNIRIKVLYVRLCSTIYVCFRLLRSQELEEDLFWAAAFAIIASYAQMFQCLRKTLSEVEVSKNVDADLIEISLSRNLS